MSLTDTVHGLWLSSFVLLSQGNKPDLVHSSEGARDESNWSILVFCVQGVQQKPQQAEQGEKVQL